MSRLSIFTNNEQLKFDLPPKFTKKQRASAFVVTEEVKVAISAFRSDTNRVGFILQLGYFKVSGKFFSSEKYRDDDIFYVASLLSISHDKIDISNYTTKTRRVHKNTILNCHGWTDFSKIEKANLVSEIGRHVKQQLHPRQLMNLAINYLLTNKVALPTYHCIADIITDSYNSFEDKLLTLLKQKLTSSHIEELEALLLAYSNDSSATKIMVIKKLEQSLKPKQIQKNIELFNYVKKYFVLFKPIIHELNLSAQATEYYAVWIEKAKLSQINQFKNRFKTYMYLLAFIKHQYCFRADVLVDILIKCVTSSQNKAIKTCKQNSGKNKKARNVLINKITENARNSDLLVSNIEGIIKSTDVDDKNKLETIEKLISEYHDHHNDLLETELLELEDFASGDKTSYFACLAEGSNKLQRRVSGILQTLDFNENSSDSGALVAINYFHENSAKINKTAPTNFLTPAEKKAIFQEDKINPSLYKSLLFVHAVDDIKAGRLNLRHSYKYLSIYDYLLEGDEWNARKQVILSNLELDNFSDYGAVMGTLKTNLNNLIISVNEKFISNENPYLKLDTDRKVKVSTPATDSSDAEFISKLLSQERTNQVPIFNLLSEINSVTNFSRYIKHHSVKNSKKTNQLEYIFAGLIGLGCNIGIAKLANISKGVSYDKLKDTVTWSFSLKNIQAATNRIIEYINRLSLPNIFCCNQGVIHTSSDGQKINVSVDSLIANYSFKYFGKNKGVSIYTFVDDKQSLFYSTVISASEREAAYVIDGLMANDVVKSSLHSTDTHGFTETIFGTTYLLETAFAPRIKNIGNQLLYSFSSKSFYETRGCTILPHRKINTKIIRDNWDDILRFIATIKSRHVSASSLFKRLSSYSKHHPLYQALREFGRIIKSIFMLKYYDDVGLRQQMEKQLNRVELSNKFSKAILFANNQEFREARQQEQEIIVACKALIQNAIILWNYLCLSQILLNSGKKERVDLVQLISTGSVICWSHVNLHGEYDFEGCAANDDRFNMQKILSLQIRGF